MNTSENNDTDHVSMSDGSNRDANSEKKVLLVTEYFHPDTASSGRLMTDLAVGLHRRGLDVNVYTGQSNYYGSERDQQPRMSVYHGVTVERIAAPQLPPTTLPRRLFNWLLFSSWTFFGLLFKSVEKDCELVFLTNPPFQSVFMWVLCTIRGWDYTYIVHDVYPDHPIELGIIQEGSVIATVWSWLQRRVYADAHHVVTNGSMMRKRIVENCNGALPPTEVTVIHNWEHEDHIELVEKRENWFCRQHGLVEPFVVLYSGNIGLYHEFETIIDAAAELATKNVVFLFIGDGDAKQNAVSYAKAAGVYESTVKFLPYQSRDTLPYSLGAGDVNLISVAEGLEGANLSLKIYTAMAAGKPVLAVASPTDDESLIIDEYDIGEHISHGDVDEVVRTIDKWMSDTSIVEQYGAKARTAHEKNFTCSRAVDEYHTLFTEGGESVADSFQNIEKKYGISSTELGVRR